MPVAKIKFNIRYHFTEMIRNWSGKESTHRKITETIDGQGNVIDRSTTEATIYAIIGNPTFDEKTQPPGFLQSGDLCMYYWYGETDDDVLVSKQLTPTTIRHDQIDFQGTTYNVQQLQDIAYDILVPEISHEPIFAKYLLRKVAPT